MKQLTCEMCGSTDLVKQDGVFVCQACGCKYSVEEAKKMMVEGTVEVQGTVTLNNEKKIENLRELANRARNTGDSKTAAQYYGQLLLECPNDWGANFYTVFYDAHNIKIAEIGAAAFRVSGILDTTFELICQFLPESQRLTAMEQIYADVIQFSDLLLANARKNMPPDILSIGVANLNRMDSSAVERNLALTHQKTDEWLAPIFRMLLSLGDCMMNYAKEYEKAKSAYQRIDNYSITPLTSEIGAVKKQKLFELKRLSRDAYWANHTAEKTSLEVERAELQSKIDELTQRFQQSPEVVEINELEKQIAEHTQHIGSLGLLQAKEKRTIRERIDRLTTECNTLKERLSLAKAEIIPIQARITEIDQELARER